MSFSKPADANDWDLNETNSVAPDVGHTNDGWQDGEEPPAGFFNYTQNLNYKWFRWVDERMSDGGSSSDLVISAPQTEGGDITLLSGSEAGGGANSGNFLAGSTPVTGASADSGNVTLRSGSSATDDSGPVVVESGISGILSGTVTVKSGDSSQATGALSVFTGDSGAAFSSGDIAIRTGVGGSVSGELLLATGQCVQDTGDVFLRSGNSVSQTSGDLTVSTGTGQVSGSIDVFTGDSDGTGSVDINSGNSLTDPSGFIRFASGSSSSSDSGTALLASGVANAGSSGTVTLLSGAAINSGALSFVSGNATGVVGTISASGGDKVAGTGPGGNIIISGGNASGVDQPSGFVNIISGQSTGLDPGSVNIQASQRAQASGSTLNPIQQVVEFTGEGALFNKPIVLNPTDLGTIGTDTQIVVPFTAAGALSAGEVVILDAPNQREVIRTTNAEDETVVGFVARPNGLNSTVLIAVGGVIEPIGFSGGAPAVGEYVQTSSALGLLKATAGPAAAGTNIGIVIQTVPNVLVLISKS